jgi:SAM-dependent methyltransferase
VDVNPYNIAHCLKEGLDASLVVDGKFPFEKSYFDTVILDNVIEHIDHPGAVLQESTRVLSESGRLIIGVPGLKGYHSDTDHVIFHDKNSLSIILRSVGFCLRNSFSTPFIFQSQLLSTRFSRYSSYFVFSRAIGY